MTKETREQLEVARARIGHAIKEFAEDQVDTTGLIYLNEGECKSVFALLDVALTLRGAAARAHLERERLRGDYGQND
jgi:hypothetical protein